MPTVMITALTAAPAAISPSSRTTGTGVPLSSTVRKNSPSRMSIASTLVPFWTASTALRMPYVSSPAIMRSVTDAEPASVTNTGGGAYTGPKACRQLKASVSGPESNVTRSTSPPISRLNAEAGLSRIGNLNPDFSTSPLFGVRLLPTPKTGCPAAALLSFFPFSAVFTASPVDGDVDWYILSAVDGELLVSSALSPATTKLPSGT